MKSPVTAALFVLLLTGCAHQGWKGPSVIVIGVDGMDPNFLERHWNDLPNLRGLRDKGGLTRLATTTPPQSPVAWSVFATGMDPEQNGIFDFVHRDPATMQPLSSFAEVFPPSHQLAIGPYLLPLSRSRVRSFRRGRTYWEILTAHGVPVEVIRMPVNYPPAGGGEELAGMGTPDLEGTFGTFTFYSDDPLEASRDVPGGRFVAIEKTGDRVILPVQGPPNTLRRDRRPTHLDVVVDIDPAAPVMRARVEDQDVVLKETEWSPWIHVRFPLVPGVAAVRGMFRLYVKELHPSIRIYRSPLNIDPSDAALPISQPVRFSRDLASQSGPFYTQGIEEDTSALRQGALNLSEYLAQSRLAHAEHETLLDDALARFRGGLLFFYFSEIDQNSHVLWGRHEAELLETYREVDQDIGRVLDRARGGTVIVMSDHGFAAFDRAMNLNTWLTQQGLLAVKENRQIDWARTRAYAMGLNAIYVNLAGREEYGFVHVGAQKNAVIQEIQKKLTEFTDIETGSQPVSNVTRVGPSSSVYAPDLIVGYAPSYRASWETALGEVPRAVLVPNEDAWIADHCIDANAVPGVLLGTKPPRNPKPRLKDLPVAILGEFGIAPDLQMSGAAVY